MRSTASDCINTTDKPGLASLLPISRENAAMRFALLKRGTHHLNVTATTWRKSRPRANTTRTTIACATPRRRAQ
jgi:hypothetical protein